METIEFTSEIKFGDTVVDEIAVGALTFKEVVGLWMTLDPNAGGFAKVLQRARIMKQTVFKSKGEIVPADDANITGLPIDVARSIIDKLDAGSGTPGKVVTDGDAISSPIVYKLGTPIRMTNAKKKTVEITELEFMAKTFGDVEDVLAAGNDVEKGLMLLQTLAKPVGKGVTLSTIPGWAIDQMTVSDGFMVVNTVAKHF